MLVASWLLATYSLHLYLSNCHLCTEQPKAPTVTIIRVEQTSISLSWEVSKTCFESLNFTITISWMPASGEGQAMNVSGSSYNITALTPGVSYNITLVAIGNGVRSDCISISATTLSNGKHNISMYILSPALASKVDTRGRMYARVLLMYLLYCKIWLFWLGNHTSQTGKQIFQTFRPNAGPSSVHGKNLAMQKFFTFGYFIVAIGGKVVITNVTQKPLKWNYYALVYYSVWKVVLY